MPRRSGLQRQSVRTQIKQSVEKSEFQREREERRQREQWEFEHAWRNRPLDERKRLLAATEDVQVAYDGCRLRKLECRKADGALEVESSVVTPAESK